MACRKQLDAAGAICSKTLAVILDSHQACVNVNETAVLLGTLFTTLQLK